MTNSNEAAARHLATKGAEAIAEVQALVDRAMVLLPEVGEGIAGSYGGWPGPEPFDWEIAEIDRDIERDIWMAAVEDSATGEGITGHFILGLFHDEVELRQRLAFTLGRHLANAAKVANRSTPLGSAPFYVSPLLMKAFEEMLAEVDGPGCGEFVARFHLNYS